MSVGKVVGKALDPQGNRTIATIELDNKYAPIHVDARAILREKTILGETYVELTPDRGRHRCCPTARCWLGAMSNRRSSSIRSSTRSTRHATRVPGLAATAGLAVTGNGQNLNNALGNLPQFAADSTDVLRVLDIEHRSLLPSSTTAAPCSLP